MRQTEMAMRILGGMQRWYASMAVVLMAAVCPAFRESYAILPQQGDGSESPLVLEKPLKVRLRTQSDGVLKGDLLTWDGEGFSGTFTPKPAQHRWVELIGADLARTYKLLMDQQSAGQWINLGKLLLIVPESTKAAETAFKSALALDRTLGPQIETARTEAAEVKRLASHEKLLETLPIGRDYGSQRWEVLSAEQQVEAVAQMRTDAEQVCRDVGASVELLETDFFLCYSELPRSETQRWGSELDAMYRRVARDFSIPPDLNLFWGKAVIFIFPSRDRFVAAEAAAFQQVLPPGVMGLCHMRGPKVFVNMFRQSDDMAFASVLVHETVHGIMHRFLTPIHLPTWADEGFSEYVAATSFSGSPTDRTRRPQALEFIRSGNPIGPIMEMDYQSGSWPGPDAIGYAIGYVTVELMIRDRPTKFGDWVRAVKAGKDWRQALTEDFGAKPADLAARAQEFYRTND